MSSLIPAGIYLLNLCHSAIFIVNFEHISRLALVFLLLTAGMETENLSDTVVVTLWWLSSIIETSHKS